MKDATFTIGIWNLGFGAIKFEIEAEQDSIHDAINGLIKQSKVDTNLISDGYHTYGQLYEHRITLYIALCRIIANSTYKFDQSPIWRSETMSDGSKWDGWFLLGMCQESGEQITYHLPMSKWGECNFAETLDKAPEWDHHTSEDVLKRLKNL